MFQISFVSSLPFPFDNLNLPVLAAVFILMLSEIRYSLWWGIGMGLVYDMYMFQPFGMSILCLFIVIFLSQFLLNFYLTNKSLYSFLVITGLAVAIHNLLLRIIWLMIQFYREGSWSLDFSAGFFLQQFDVLAVNLVATFFLFHASNYITHRLKPFILVRG